MHLHPLALIILLCCCHLKAVDEIGCEVSEEYYSQSQYKVKCGLWGWWRCKQYRTNSHYRNVCCPGWINNESRSHRCNLALCDGKTDLTGACQTTISNGLLLKTDGTSVTQSGGHCSKPGVCTNCGKGFRSENGYCKVCPQIDNCDFELCGYNPTYNRCVRCNGFYGDSPGSSAFKKYNDGCRELCSWRSTSTACWPGKCGHSGFKDNCNCHSDFGGRNCRTIRKRPTILEASVKLEENSGGGRYRTLVANDPNQVDVTQDIWTNEENVSRISVDSKAHWKVTLPPKPRYVSPERQRTSIGIVEVNWKMTHIQANGYDRSILYQQDCNSRVSRHSPEGRIPVACASQQSTADRTFQHGTSLSIGINYVAGGFMTVVDKENHGRSKYNFKEAMSSFTLIYKFDFKKPYNDDSQYFLQLSTEKAKMVNEIITATFRGWRDDDSGVNASVTVSVQRLNVAGDRLVDICGGNENIDTVPYASGIRKFSVSRPGVYSVILTVHDEAGNHERARRFFTYDPYSRITIKPGTFPNISSAASNTSQRWQHHVDKPIIIMYSWDRYTNLNHSLGKWLSPVDICNDMADEYDDRDGLRTVEAIKNNQGIVKLEIGYRLVTEPVSTILYKPVDRASSMISFDVSKTNGNVFELFVRATDYMDTHFVEKMTLRIDSTPPVIANLWLIRDGVRKLAVHNSSEFWRMAFEWETYDFQSGIRQVSWSIYDNHTDHGQVVYHGNQSIGHQGRRKDLATCQREYFDKVHGPDCYCVASLGCFHKDFYVRPSISHNNGLHPDRSEGIHDGDYFIVITVENLAMLVSTLTKKITIDTSPPRPGVVNDGPPGSPDVDYQSNGGLVAHWDGFFDHESGVVYYQYFWGTSCANASIFGTNYDNAKVKKTNRNSTRWMAPAAGIYHITVVAFNAALDHSDPVCSDGIVVDVTPPIIGGVGIKYAKTKPGLIKWNGTVYYIGHDRRKILISAPSQSCIALATSTDAHNYLDAAFKNGSMKTASTRFCETQYPLSLTAYTPLTRDMYISANWSAHDPESGILSYQFGLMTTLTAKDAPDILPYTSTHLGDIGHIKLTHPGLSAGQVFSIGVKACNKASLETIKVFGPFVVEVTPPSFNGKININTEESELIARWNTDDFIDGESKDPFSYKFAVGTLPGHTDVLPWSPLTGGVECNIDSSPNCTRVDMSSSSRQLHPGDEYYISIKATNFVGMAVVAISDPIQHFTDLPSKGVVIDVSPANERLNVTFGHPDDVDYQESNSSLEMLWYGFERPYHDTFYRVAVGSSPGSQNIAKARDVVGSSYIFEGLYLTADQTYYSTLWARNKNGEVNMSSDGVNIIRTCSTLKSKVHDGLKTCALNQTCGEDIDYQISSSVLSAHWSIPDQVKKYGFHVLWKIEQQNDIIDPTSWVTFEDFLDLRMATSITKGNLGLISGLKYRSVLRFCHSMICYPDIRSDGVLVLAKPPVASSLSVTLQDLKKIKVVFERYFEPDIPELYAELSRSVVDVYQWAVTVNSDPGQHITEWKTADINNLNTTLAEFVAILDYPLAFKECYQLFLRGVSKAGISTIISKEIKDCETVKREQPIVIDACGSPVIDQATNMPVPRLGQPIQKALNEPWEIPDQDFTPYTNILSATWPSLRSHNYTYAVITDNGLGVFTHYQRPNRMVYKDPCSLPTAIKCGTTGDEHVSINFPKGSLVHGKRYYICIHADPVTQVYEKWKETLSEVNSCSDGITVDLTPPKQGNVWFGTRNINQISYSTSTSELLISWSGFKDVEEDGKSTFHNGIRSYEYSIGSDGVFSNFVSAGLTDHVMIHGLKLQDGHTYYAKVRARDYVNLTTVATSLGVTIDTTAPAKTDESFVLKIDHTSKPIITAGWGGIFSDQESGISHYEWCIGSEVGYADIMPYTRTEQTQASSENNLTLHDGHVYYVAVKAFNKAGLSTLASAWQLLFDASPPTKGHVFDGRRDQATSKQKDQDYQSDTDHIWVYWGGFHDPHSDIASYSLLITTCHNLSIGSRCENLLSHRHHGENTDAVIASPEVNLRPGVIYHVTVTACNGVGMCTSGKSDGVLIDNTPPIGGIVHDGIDDQDIDAHSSSTYIGAKWWGFFDPESGISHYSWWAGTTPGGHDILEKERLHQTEEAFRLQLPGDRKLPVNTTIYTTVEATNYAGLSTNATSNGFKVVTTSPMIVHKPTHIDTRGSVYRNTQVLGTIIGVSWKFEDTTPIAIQFVHLHTDGFYRLDMPTSKVGSMVNNHYFANVSLHDGTNYQVTVTACNLAKQCTSSTSDKILVDNTPPLTGTFAIDTDHASNVGREGEGLFTWNTTSLCISVLGFVDVHSGIYKYDVAVGSRYGSRDITNDQMIRFAHNDNITSERKKVEGSLQVFELIGTNISTNLKTGTYIFISVTAINGVGLVSDILQKKFRLLADGRLSMIRRCQAELCEGHCVCSPHNERCPRPKGKCSSMLPNGVNLTVFDIIDLRENVSTVDVDYTPFTCTMAATWKLDSTSTTKPISYDYTIGLTSRTEPDGVLFHDDSIWHSVGLQTRAIHTRRQHGTYLRESVRYSFFIRAWITPTEYHVFKSNGVVPAIRPPALARKHASVKDCQSRDLKNSTTFVRDVDFYNRTDYYCIYWKDAFLDRSVRHFDQYYASVGTFPGGDDICSSDASMSFYKEMFNLTLKSGRRYFSNVRTCNKAGLCNERHSDGVIIDVHPPSRGVINDGQGLHDVDYQNSTRLVAAHWSGFVDLGSGIDHYMWCVGITPSSDECDMQSWLNVGLQTRVRKQLSTPSSSGSKIFNKVFAVDAAGHLSLVAVSDGVTIDTSPPGSIAKTRLGGNIIKNPSFEEDLGISMATAANQSDHITTQVPKGWNITKGTAVTCINDTKIAEHETQSLLLFGSIYQELKGLLVGERYIVMVYLSHNPTSHSPTATQQGSLGLPDGKRHVFQLNRTERHDVVVGEKVFGTNWSKYVFYFKAAENSGNLTISTIGRRNSFIVDDVSVECIQYINTTENLNRSSTAIHFHYDIFTHNWQSMTIGWDFEDKESPIVEYKLAIGTRKGDSRLYGYRSQGLDTFTRITNLNLDQGSNIFITVIARNAADLPGYLFSTKILIDKTPPVIQYVWDGDKEDGDVSYMDSTTVTAKWNASDPESGIQYCEYGIGTVPGGLDVQQFQKVKEGQKNIAHNLSPPIPSMIYTTIRCHNSVGGTTTLTSDGAGIVLSEPDIKNANVRVITGSTTFYPNQMYAGRTFQSSTQELFLQWFGFDDPSGIIGYEVRVIGKGVWDETIHIPDGSMTYMRVTSLGMRDGATYQVEVRAVNSVGQRSHRVHTEVTIDTTPPLLNGTNPVVSWIVTNKTFIMDWSDVFLEDNIFSYEVSLGTVKGGADIKQWQETKYTNMTFELTTASLSDTFHSTITAINPAGLYTTMLATIRWTAILSVA